MEAEGYSSREQIMAHIFETAEREAWSDGKLTLRLEELRITASSLKQIMRVYREHNKVYGKITEAQWREVLNAWRDEKETMTGPYNALRCYEVAKEVEGELRHYEGISVRWKTGGYDHTVKSEEEYLELEIGCGADLVAIIEEIYERGWYGLSGRAQNFLEKLCRREKYRRSLFD